MRHRLIALFVLTEIGLGACTFRGYEGPGLAPQSVARIQARTTLGFIPMHEALVTGLDGRQVGFVYLIEVLPGSHTAGVYFREAIPGYFGGITLHRTGSSVQFTAKAGSEYRIPGRYKCGQFWLWVEEVGSGAVVGGTKAPENCNKAPALQNQPATKQPAPTAPSSAPMSQQTTAPQLASANAVDVPFRIDLQGQQYDGVGRLENGHLAGQILSETKSFVIGGEIRGNELSVEVRGVFDPRGGNYEAPGRSQCSAEGSAQPASGQVTISMQATCAAETVHLTILLNLPVAGVG